MRARPSNLGFPSFEMDDDWGYPVMTKRKPPHFIGNTWGMEIGLSYGYWAIRIRWA